MMEIKCPDCKKVLAKVDLEDEVQLFAIRLTCPNHDTDESIKQLESEDLP